MGRVFARTGPRRERESLERAIVAYHRPMGDPDEDLAASRLGSQAGTWTLERVLGIGAMGSVFLGKRTDGSVAAVKILHQRYAGVDAIRKRFLREGPIGSALAAVGPLCEGLPQILEAAPLEDGTAYLAMELLEGESVFDAVSRTGVLPVGEVLRIAQKVLDVLSVAHAYGVVHRDLKPENLHLGKDGRLKVLDFGIARVTEALPDYVGELPEQTITRTGTALGSCEYMAPEQAMGNIREIDGRTDLFGLGATMYRLLSGRCIHGDLADAKLMIAAATKHAPPLLSVAPGLPPRVCGVVERALAFAKTERYPDAATMRFDVVAVKSGREPPYVLAVEQKRVKPGEGLFSR
jgi:eukaryotic-like serine/threonine-protein kinase